MVLPQLNEPGFVDSPLGGLTLWEKWMGVGVGWREVKGLRGRGERKNWG